MIVNAISLSRVVIGLLFVLVFCEVPVFFYISGILCLLALGTDVLDGAIARKFGIASIEGRHWDSLGDKAFYVAVIVAFQANQLLSPAVAWALLTREVALYITRILYIERLRRIEEIRPYTNWHGYFMYAMIALGFVEMLGRLYGSTTHLYIYIQASAFMALIFGVASIFAFIKLTPG